MTTKKKSVGMTALIFVLFFSLILPVATSRMAQATSNISYMENYSRAGIQYSTTSSALGSSQVQYQTIKGSYYGGAANNTVALKSTNYVGTAIGGPTSFTISVTSEYFTQNGTVEFNLSGNGGTLLYASVEQDNESQIIWTGMAQINSSSSVATRGTAYVNGSQLAVLTLGFAGTKSIVNLSSGLGTTASFTLNVPKFTFTQSSTSTVNAKVTAEIPARYSSLNIDGGAINSSAKLVTPVANAGASSFANATLPDIMWKASAGSSVSFQGSSVPVNVSTATTEFFGTNGSVTGYVQILNLNSAHSVGVVGTTNSTVEIFDSSTMLLHSSMNLTTTSASRSTVEVGGQLVLLQSSQSGLLLSTANIEIQHQVILNGSFVTLVMLSTNSTSSAYFLVYGSNNATVSVTPVTPSSESQTTITVNSTTFSAMQVNITGSGSLIFNVSSAYPSVVVFKETSSGVVKLASSNYWTANGRVYVFDDPSSTYYLANSQNTAASTTAATSNATLMWALAIAVIAIVVGGVVGLAIRRKPGS